MIFSWTQAWLFARENALTIIRVNALFLAFIVLGNYLFALLAMNLTYYPAYQKIFLILFASPVSAFFIGGMIYFYLGLVRGTTQRAAQIYRGYKWILSITIYIWLFYFFGNMVFLPFVEMLDNQWNFLRQMHTITSAVIFIWFWLRTSFTLVLIVDKNVPIVSAIGRSLEITRGQLFLTLRGWLLAGICIVTGFAFLGLGIFFFLGIANFFILRLYFHLEQNPLQDNNTKK